MTDSIVLSTCPWSRRWHWRKKSRKRESLPRWSVKMTRYQVRTCLTLTPKGLFAGNQPQSFNVLPYFIYHSASILQNPMIFCFRDQEGADWWQRCGDDACWHQTNPRESWCTSQTSDQVTSQKDHVCHLVWPTYEIRGRTRLLPTARHPPRSASVQWWRRAEAKGQTGARDTGFRPGVAEEVFRGKDKKTIPLLLHPAGCTPVCRICDFKRSKEHACMHIWMFVESYPESNHNI